MAQQPGTREGRTTLLVVEDDPEIAATLTDVLGSVRKAAPGGGRLRYDSATT